MSSLNSVGRATAGRSVQNAYQVNEQLVSETDAPTSAPWVDGRAIALGAAKADKKYVDDQDAKYSTAAYFAGQDALLVPLSAKGTPNGVATLGADGKIPAAQLPALGSGYLRGPWGHVNAYPGTTGQVKLKIADWGTRPGVTAHKCQILAWMSVSIACSKLARPVVEIRVGGTGDTTYASQVLVARGYGRLYYEDSQVVTVQPCSDTTSRVATTNTQLNQFWLDPNFDARLTAWLYDETSAGQVSLMQTDHVAASSAWVFKVAI